MLLYLRELVYMSLLGGTLDISYVVGEESVLILYQREFWATNKVSISLVDVYICKMIL